MDFRVFYAFSLLLYEECFIFAMPLKDNDLQNCEQTTTSFIYFLFIFVLTFIMSPIAIPFEVRFSM